MTLLAVLAGCYAGGPAEAQPPYHQEVISGLTAFDLGDNASPALADLDGDGDLDVLVSGTETDGQPQITELRYLENVGSPTVPRFVERLGEESPLHGLNPGLALNPDTIDLDGDGDLDLVAGDVQATVHYFENTGTPTAPNFEIRTGVANPFDDLELAPFAGTINPHLLDADDDGDPDLVLHDGTWLRYFENTGSLSEPVYERRNGADNPFNVAGVGSGKGIYSADLDDDGDLDAVLGTIGGMLAFLENTGSASAPVFMNRTGAANPFDGLSLGFATDPGIADLDGDGDLDVTVGRREGILRLLDNTGSPQAPAFVELRGGATPFGDGYISGRGDPLVGDLDDDDDFDAFFGDSQGHLHYFENIGSPATPSFVEVTGPANPLFFDFGSNSSADLIDLDGDLDLDAVVGAAGGTLFYLENVGSVVTPSFEVRIGNANPFDLFDFNAASSPDFGDLDGDGDFDAVVGMGSGSLAYLENTGSPLAPQFIQQGGASNPFDGIDVGSTSTPELVDFDGDNDLDAVIGNITGELVYYRNIGSPTVPVFVQQTGADNPFDRILRFDRNNPVTVTVTDLDDDGDLDLLAGQDFGVVVYLRSSFTERMIFRDGFESGDTTLWSSAVPP